ncbi:MAG: radical SAM protein, partial [Cyanobacteria bacterium REEB65]|nr:radical SAM protein [Cyanobacteria bacterium REEB65]
QPDGRPWPLVFAGGPNAFNPEPFADFVDFVVVGDGEEVVCDLVDAFKGFQEAGMPRLDRLRGLSQIRGVYVPQFYEVEYLGPNQPILRWIPLDDAPFPVRKNAVQELLPDFHPTNMPVPYLPVVHDRVPTEVRRGCDAGCRYCQAGFIYLPVRERKAKDVVDLTSQTIGCTGYEEYSLFSLSSGDYTQSAEVVQPLTERNSPLGASMSLPSLRVDSFSLSMATAAQHIRKSTFTFAPEAGSQRMRDIINKNISEDEIRYAIRESYRAGWQTLKLYFMIGLPGETQEDVAEIVALVDRIRQDCAEIRRADPKPRPPIRINLTVSTFVPKPHVPFQWRAQDTLDEIAGKQTFLFREMKARGVKVNAHDRHTSELEAVLSRGDRRLGRLVKRAWELGAAHDAWS